MFAHTYYHRVRYRECDPMGVVYHAHYVNFFEDARTEALREIGMVYRELEEAGIIMPVVDLSVEYKGPALYDDVLEIETRLEEVPRVRVPIAYEVRRRAEADLLATGRVTLCFMDAERRRPVRTPEHVRRLFEDAVRP